MREYEGNREIQAHCLAASLNYVKYSFRRENGKPFIVSRHHEQLCRAIDDVYDGKIIFAAGFKVAYYFNGRQTIN